MNVKQVFIAEVDPSKIYEACPCCTSTDIGLEFDGPLSGFYYCEDCRVYFPTDTKFAMYVQDDKKIGS